ncbi:hypothetical protein Tco_1545170, partial [Tanacetum coccineum]
PFNDTYETPKHSQKVFANMRRKGKSFSGTVTPLFQCMLAIQEVEGEGSGQPSEPQPTPSLAPPSHEVQVTTVASHPQKTHTPRVVRAATTATSLEAEQESGNIHMTRSKATLNEPSPQGTGSEVNTYGSGEDSMEHQDDLTDFIPPTPHNSPLLGGHTPISDEGCLRFGDQKVKKECQKIGKEAKGKNSKDETLQDWPMFEEGDFDDDFDDINDMENEAIENVEGDTVNAGGAVNTATIGVSAASASVTTAGVSISTVEPRTPPRTTTTAFE